MKPTGSHGNQRSMTGMPAKPPRPCARTCTPNIGKAYYQAICLPSGAFHEDAFQA